MTASFCIWQRLESPGEWHCVICGRRRQWVREGNPPLRNCGNPSLPARQPAVDGPSIGQRAINFAKAAFRQAPLSAAAFFTGDDSKAFRSQAEIEAIAKTCKACPLFNGEVCMHKDCGCPVDAERNAWWSKIAWRSQKCPDNPPMWT